MNAVQLKQKARIIKRLMDALDKSGFDLQVESCKCKNPYYISKERVGYKVLKEEQHRTVVLMDTDFPKEAIEFFANYIVTDH